jgi:hypothetical protein
MPQRHAFFVPDGIKEVENGMLLTKLKSLLSPRVLPASILRPAATWIQYIVAEPQEQELKAATPTKTRSLTHEGVTRVYCMHKLLYAKQ